MLSIITGMLTDVGFLGAFFQTIVIIFFGFLFRRRGIIAASGKQALTALEWKLCVPCLAFDAFMTDFSAQELVTGGEILLLSLVFYIAAALLSRLAFRRQGANRATALALFVAIGQLTLFSTPILQSIYPEPGSEVIFDVSIMTLPFRFMVYIVSFFVLSGLKLDRKNLRITCREVFLNPIIIAMLLGIFIWLTQNLMPQVLVGDAAYGALRLDKTLTALYTPVQALQRMVGPLAMFLIGISLGEAHLNEALRDRLAWLAAVLRTVAVPACVLAVLCALQALQVIHFNAAALTAMVIGFAAPSSATVSLFAIQYDREAQLGSRVCLLSTFLCLLSFPLCYLLVQLALTLPCFA